MIYIKTRKLKTKLDISISILLLCIILLGCNHKKNIICYYDNKNCKLSANMSILVENIQFYISDSNSKRYTIEKSTLSQPESISLCNYIDSLCHKYKPSNDTIIISLNYYFQYKQVCEFQYFISKKGVDTIYELYEVRD
jgi:hypothetical protein